MSSPSAGHCKEPPPWEHESLKRVYHFMEGQTVRYQCLPGFRDGSAQNNSAQSVCKKQEDQEVMRWTQPKLKCKSEKENGSFPGMQRPPGSPGCSLGRTVLGLLTHPPWDPGQALPLSLAGLCFSHSRK